MKKNKIEKIMNKWHFKMNQKAADSSMDDFESN
jgi:hypothetical protein